MGLLRDVLNHPEEIPALYQMRIKAKNAKKFPKNKSLAFCYEILNNVSRSFAIVIQTLPEELRDAVCVFYLVLRALDTVEDDMAIKMKEKIPMLLSFYEKCTDRSFVMDVGTGEYNRLMKEYPLVVDAFIQLKPEYQDVIAEITRRMGAGMAEFIPKEVEKVEEYDKYCFYVAGLVGVGLSKLFAVSELESEDFLEMEEISDAMGKFLQKTNIIRDYLEDINELPAPRMFWPKEIWGDYADKLEDFKEEENADAAVQCLNHLVTNALTHMPDCFDYMSKLTNQKIFQFCAIPQVMAIATLAECYNNPRVFTGVVKIRRGMSARICMEVTDMGKFCKAVSQFAHQLAMKVEPTRDPNAQETLKQIEQVEDLCAEHLLKLGLTRPKRGGEVAVQEDDQPIPMGVRLMLLVLFGGYLLYAWGVGKVRTSLGVDPGYNGQPPLDYFNKFMSVVMFIIVFYVVYQGRKW
uniref:Squalene synthase n=1 Tax=Pyramimonas obovata TaxID=1411642 RepID=A0A7S0N0L4_9CHLO|mmetsp:Transcript_17480/g.38077  ORF Transcript_17480/g.38077 Transcript_17480/m.38077 type:complete len:464 (+) Transcript_17480:99-1490(+)